MVDDLCIVGEPEDGAVEIGYGTYEKFRNQGFMTEIVSGINEWSKTQNIVKSIIASTDKTSAASFKLLQKNGIVKIGEEESLFNWKLEIKKI
ncbi:MAG TPA: GNAT family N-acetyltransferase [Edaphocola sp.]|nr:GNAT family N-acetyltransferase [Edaphocola sp.]